MSKKARNVAPANNKIALGDDMAEKARGEQSLRYYEGQSEAGKNKPFSPGQASSPNDLGEVVDLSGKIPYGGKAKGWAANSGKLGDLDPQEQDQPGWVGTWSPLQEGPNGAGAVRDENYGVQRPRTQSRQEERFKYCNPEFQDVADEGDWTSARFNPKV